MKLKTTQNVSHDLIDATDENLIHDAAAAHALMVEKVREVIAAHMHEASLLAHDPESRDYLNEQANKLASAIGDKP